MSVNSKMTAIADKVRALLGISGKIGLDAMETNLGTAVEACDSQAALIAQIKTALEGKAAGGSGGGYAGGQLIVENETPDSTNLPFTEGIELVCPNATSIPDGAFKDCTALTYIQLPSVTSIGDAAFFSCSIMDNIKLPAVTSIGQKAFCYCQQLRSVELPSLVSIGEAAFEFCRSLTTIVAPKVTMVPANTFEQCQNLKDVELQGATEIGELAFYECLRLLDVTFPSARYIATGNGASFAGCTNLETIDLPMAVSIGPYAFSKCVSLKTLILRTTETVCVCDLTALDETPMLTGKGHVYVPTVMYEYYRAGYEPVIGSDMFDVLFRKIEDYPEICG